MEVDKMALTGESLSIDPGVVNQIRRVVDEATSRGGWWDSGPGREARRYLELWGAVVRERLVTKDPCAIPKCSVGVGANGARTFDSQASILMTFESVERWWKGLKPFPRRLLWMLYVQGTEERLLVVAYKLANGTLSAPCLRSDPVPPAFLAYERVIDLASGWVQTKTAGDFLGPIPLGRYLARWGVSWNWLMDSVHEKLGRELYDVLLKPAVSSEAVAERTEAPSVDRLPEYGYLTAEMAEAIASEVLGVPVEVGGGEMKAFLGDRWVESGYRRGR